MLHPIEQLTVDVTPQAIIKMPIARAIGSSAKLIEDIDDLDHFVGATYRLDEKFEVAVRHYRDFPPDTATIYIDRKVVELETITSLIRQILSDLKIPEKALEWERQDDPAL